MTTIEHAFLLDIILGKSFGRLWHPEKLPEPPPHLVPPTILIDGNQLAAFRLLLEEDHDRVAAAVAGLKHDASRYLDAENPTVTAKPKIIPGTTPNDYCSLAKYWWPSEDGTYLLRDGDVNPETFSDSYDAVRLDQFSERTLILSLAGYFDTRSEGGYAAKAASMVRTWIIDPATRQNPNLRFSQIVPNQDRIRFQGIVESRRLAYVCEAIRILGWCGALDEGEIAECKSWFASLLDWIEGSDQGRLAIQARNNIGFWVDLQRLVFARFIDDESRVKRIIRASVLPRISEQISPDGELQRELTRAKPHDYVAFTLLALSELSAASREGNLKLTELGDEEGRNFELVYDWFEQAINSNRLADRATSLARLADAERRAARYKLKLLQLTKKQPADDGQMPAPGAYSPISLETTGAPPPHKGGPGFSEALLDATYCKAAAILVDQLNLENRQKVNLLRRQRKTLFDLLREAEGQIDPLSEKNATLIKDLAIIRGQMTSLKGDLSDAMLRAEAIERSSAAKIQSLTTRLEATKANREEAGRRLAELGARLDAERKRRKDGERAQNLLRHDLDSAVAWQKRSWATRAFHRWRRPSQGPFKRRPLVGRLLHSLNKRLGLANRSPRSSGGVPPRPAQPPASTPANARSSASPQQPAHDAQAQETCSQDPQKSFSPAADPSLWTPPPPPPGDTSHTIPNTFALYRIIGNSLFPRHDSGQSLTNLRFILDHEEELSHCEKRWVVNRIVNPAEETAIISLLQGRGQNFIHLPFDSSTYSEIPFNFNIFPQLDFFFSKEYFSLPEKERTLADAQLRRLKNLYVMHNNGARNRALEDGRARARWVLPFDGNCFFTPQAWSELVAEVGAKPHLKYFAVPMARITSNDALLHPDFSSPATEEPQLLFRCDAMESFDESHPYGRRPKVELFWRLGIPGTWERWSDLPWDLPRAGRSTEATQFGYAGWVARLSSGQADLEQSSLKSFRDRGVARSHSIIATLDRLDASTIAAHLSTSSLVFYSELALAEVSEHYAQQGGNLLALARLAVSKAEAALSRPPSPVTHKTTLPPSGDPHDYWHPAPYWWPDPSAPDGLPYIWKDGQRVPGTRLHEPGSERYDRSRLQDLFDDSISLAIAWQITGREELALHAVSLLHSWFVDPATRMNPHLRYAQVRRGHNNDEGSNSGIIESKDFYFFLDALRLLRDGGFIGDSDMAAIDGWLRSFLHWLLDSSQGRIEVTKLNNHGIVYDLQVGAIAAYLGDCTLLAEVVRRAQGRILHHFDPHGAQPHELARTESAHYCTFNLQSWLNLADLLSHCGKDLWGFEGRDGRSLARAADWLLGHFPDRKWNHQQLSAFNWGRMLPIAASLPHDHAVTHQEVLTSMPELPACFHPHDGIRPYWMLGLDQTRSTHSSPR
jgi:hypothetical protein